MLLKLLHKKIRTFNLNFGPQHPAAHGVLRLILELHGEIILSIDFHIGLLHRGTEKLLEQKTILQGIPYFDRLDYVSMLSQEHGLVLAVERGLSILITTRVSVARVVLLEITRILNHIMCITTHALDLGAFTPFLWGFEEREKLFEIYERVSGARMHAALFRPGNQCEFPVGLLDDILRFCSKFIDRLNEFECLLTSSRIFCGRLFNVGTVNYVSVLNWGISGAISRSCGLSWDLRVEQSCEIYSRLNPVTQLGIFGDSFDRFCIRVGEMRVAVRIMKLCGLLFADYDCIGVGMPHRLTAPSRGSMKCSMESVIQHFKLFGSSCSVKFGLTISAVETPKGELTVSLVMSKLSGIFLRCKIKTPGFNNLRLLSRMTCFSFLADLVTNIGTVDIVLGEIDR